MTETLARLDEPGDAELISAVRGGDVSAYGTLFERHVEAARRLARQIAGSSDADDLVSDAFAKVLKVLQGGGGPDVAFRAYLLTAVRRLHVDKIRANSKLQSTDDMEAFDPGVPFRDTAVEGFESAAAAKAFASLPERWQAVLWHTEVEGQKPAEVAILLGMSANSVSALAYRAREGLRQAFLNSHIAELDDAECSWTHEHLGAYIRGGVSKRDAAKVEKHLDECRKCMAVYLELTEVNSNLAGILAPLLLGSAGAAYLATAAGGAAKFGAVIFLLDRSKELILANSQAAAVAGVAATAVVVGGTVVAVTGPDDNKRANDPPAIVRTQQPDDRTKTPDGPKKTRDPKPTKKPSIPPINLRPTGIPSLDDPTTVAPSPDPTTQSPSEEPEPTTEPPTEPPTPPVSDLAVAPLTMLFHDGGWHLTVDTSGYPAEGGEAKVTIYWAGMAQAVSPGCTGSGAKLECTVSDKHPQVADVVFEGRGIGLVPRVRVDVAPTSFEDPNLANNTQSWRRLVSLLRLLI